MLATINEKPNGDAVSKVVEISRAVDMYNKINFFPFFISPSIPLCASLYNKSVCNFDLIKILGIVSYISSFTFGLEICSSLSL